MSLISRPRSMLKYREKDGNSEVLANLATVMDMMGLLNVDHSEIPLMRLRVWSLLLACRLGQFFSVGSACHAFIRLTCWCIRRLYRNL